MIFALSPVHYFMHTNVTSLSDKIVLVLGLLIVNWHYELERGLNQPWASGLMYLQIQLFTIKVGPLISLELCDFMVAVNIILCGLPYTIHVQ